MALGHAESSQENSFLTFFWEFLGHIEIRLLFMGFFPITLLSFKWHLPRFALCFCDHAILQKL